ncbi:sodium bile acid symporter family protein [Venturia nashicola]|uniref:Sodium bile acid symporter family protein n=1 Tax=Venturia nashicola TaxID=86259 RepID=A0A4Z1NWR2_9PEZI|nr:sodium bile acid symporter family protein [Venturia nashicola]
MSSSHEKDVLPSDDKSESEGQNDGQKIQSQPASSSENSNSGLDTPAQGGARLVKSGLWYVKDQWFLIALGILIAIASQVQVPASHQELKTTVVTYLCVSIIFLITGCTLPTRTLIESYSRWKIHLFVQVQSFLMTSAVMFGVVSAAATNKDFMDPGLLIGELVETSIEAQAPMSMQASGTNQHAGLIFSGCLPTTISSNVVMTGQAHGNTALTVVQSTLGNFLGPFLSPVLISMYTSTGAWYTKVLPHDDGGYGEIYRRVFKQLGLSIFVPLVAGQIIQNIFPKQTKIIFTRFKLSKLASICLLVLIWQTYDQAFSSRAFQSIKASNIVFIVFMSIALFFIFLAVCFFTSTMWLPRQDTISVCYCVPAKTPAMGVPLANVMFLGLSTQLKSKIQIPMVIYQGLQIVAGSLLTMAFRHWIQPEEEAKARAKLEEEEHNAATRSEPARQLQEADNAPAA